VLVDRAADVAALFLIVWIGFHWHLPFGDSAFSAAAWQSIVTWHHWGAVVGPAEMVRQGGWLLWDTPSQYGFLNTLILAAIPTENAFHALYLLNSSLTALVGGLLFLLFRSARSGWMNYLFSLIVSMATLIAVGYQWFHVPSNGPFRYFWCFALAAVLWRILSTCDRGTAPNRTQLIVGNVVWLLGCLWSFESMVYSSVIWLPAYAVMAVVRSRRMAAAPTKASRGAIAWILLPAAMWAAAWGAIWVVYRCCIHHGPDWLSFREFVLRFSSGFGAAPIDPYGSVWIGVLVIGVVGSVIAACLENGDSWIEFAAAAGAFGLVWAPLSYFVNKGVSSNVILAAPLFLAALGICIHIARRGVLPIRTRLLLQLSLSALAIMMAMSAAKALTTDDQFVLGPFKDIESGPAAHIEQKMPVCEPSLRDGLTLAGVRSCDPVVYLDSRSNLNPLPFLTDDEGRPISLRHRVWLPLPSPNVFIPLPNARTAVYLARYLQRHQSGGWLIRRNSEVGWEFSAIVLHEVAKTHRLARSVQTDAWLFEWYEPK
jgi:hypothetical protein